MKLPQIDTMAMFLLIVGGLNAGIAAIFDYDVIAQVLGGGSMASTAVYALVGLSAVYALADHIGVVNSND
jgi:uncharacterized membrane protein YuzA (DUF378 family)